MRVKLKSAYIPTLFSINMVTVQGLAGALSLDLQTEKERLLAQVLGLNRDIDYGLIRFRADEVQRKIDKFWVHTTRATAIDWLEIPHVTERPVYISFY